MKANKKQAQTGFSLLELLTVVLILSVVVGAIFKQIRDTQSRYVSEDQKLDLTQQEREFVDQFTRDLHQSGFPSFAMYGNRYDQSSHYVAAGIWYISQTDIKLEGDLDGTGSVEVTQYHYDDGSSWSGPGANPCPCIRRSSISKVDAWPWSQNNPVYYTEIQNIISPGSTQPIFSAYKADGSAVDLSTPIVLGSGTSINSTSQQALQAIKEVRITLTTQGLVSDVTTRQLIQVTMTGMARLPNN